MINFSQQNIGRALQRRPIGGDIGGRAGKADETPVRLRIEIKTVAAQRQERHVGRHLAGARIEPRQERAAAVIFAARQRIDGEHAMIGRTAKHRVADVFRMSRDIAARRIAAARQRDDGDLARAGLRFHIVDESSELAQLVLGGGAVGLRLRIVVARLRVSEVDREQTIARIIIALEAPEDCLPDRRRVAVAMHEDDRNRRLILREGRARKPGESKRGGPLHHAAAIQHNHSP